MEKHNSSFNNGSNNNKVKLLCSYGGKIQSRPSDRHLSYVGGDTKILAVDRAVKFSEIAAKLNSLSNRNDTNDISIKYQLPGEDLDALVSLIDDDDVEHMMVEYDRMQRISAKPARLRIFIFDVSGRPGPAGKPGGAKEPVLNPDYLFGFDKEYRPSVGPAVDLLQIPGMIPSANYRVGITESHVANNMSVNAAAVEATATAVAAAQQAVYRVPAVISGGVYQTGAFPHVIGNGNREQPVYNVVPVMPLVPEQRMMVSAGNSREVKGNQRNF